jgi:hypothetical protein
MRIMNWNRQGGFAEEKDALGTLAPGSAVLGDVPIARTSNRPCSSP